MGRQRLAGRAAATWPAGLAAADALGHPATGRHRGQFGRQVRDLPGAGRRRDQADYLRRPVLLHHGLQQVARQQAAVPVAPVQFAIRLFAQPVVVGATVDLARHNLEYVRGGVGDDSFSQSGADNATMRGGGGGDTLSGGAGNDNLSGGADDDTLRGNGGYDTLDGGSGDDVYEFGRGDGADWVRNRGESASDDMLEFDGGVDADQLWFSRSGDDLVVRIVGTQDRVTVEDWYDGTDNRLDFELDDGRVLLAENVRALVDAMAAFTPPGAGETEFTAAQRPTLDPVVAANWQTPT